MRGLAVILALLVAVPAWAQDTLLEPPASDQPRDVKAGESAPAEGVWLSRPRSAWMTAQHRQCLDDKEQYKRALEEKPIQPPDKTAATALAAGGIGILLGFIAGSIVMAFAKR